MATARGLTSGAYLELDVALERGLQVSALSADTRRRGRVDRAPATGGANGAAKARVTIWRDFPNTAAHALLFGHACGLDRCVEHLKLEIVPGVRKLSSDDKCVLLTFKQIENGKGNIYN